MLRRGLPLEQLGSAVELRVFSALHGDVHLLVKLSVSALVVAATRTSDWNMDFINVVGTMSTASVHGC